MSAGKNDLVTRRHSRYAVHAASGGAASSARLNENSGP